MNISNLKNTAVKLAKDKLPLIKKNYNLVEEGIKMSYGYNTKTLDMVSNLYRTNAAISLVDPKSSKFEKLLSLAIFATPSGNYLTPYTLSSMVSVMRARRIGFIKAAKGDIVLVIAATIKDSLELAIKENSKKPYDFDLSKDFNVNLDKILKSYIV